MLRIFKDLNKKPDKSITNIYDKLKEAEKIFSDLIIIKKTTEAIYGLKNSRTISSDSFQNEMLKNSRQNANQKFRWRWLDVINTFLSITQRWGNI